MFKTNRKKRGKKAGNNQGFSMIELIIVVLIISILALSSIIAFGGKNLFYADHQAYLLMDAFKEARQWALTQRETIRVEVSKEKREIRIINENTAGDVSDDVILRTIPLADPLYLTFDAPPANMADAPVEPTPVPEANFKLSVHPLSTNENVATLRFLKNGNVVNAGSNEIGDNSVVTGATFYFWKPQVMDNGTISNNGVVIRAITVLGSSGSQNYWKCEVKDGQCSEWKH
jgi:prepilin-type N-terminal cleavage/methylation domain-containing protein